MLTNVIDTIRNFWFSHIMFDSFTENNKIIKQKNDDKTRFDCNRQANSICMWNLKIKKFQFPTRDNKKLFDLSWYTNWRELSAIGKLSKFFVVFLSFYLRSFDWEREMERSRYQSRKEKKDSRENPWKQRILKLFLMFLLPLKQKPEKHFSNGNWRSPSFSWIR